MNAATLLLRDAGVLTLVERELAATIRERALKATR